MSNKILVIDDALEARELIKAMLEGFGYQVITAVSANEALDLAKADKPMLIIIDFLMPEMDGFALFKEIKRNNEFKNVPILILTARTRMEGSFKAVGADSFLAKPIKAEELLAEVQRLLNRTDQIMPQTATSKRIDSDIELETAEQSGRLKKVLIFGFNKNVLKNMKEQLRKESCTVDIVEEERELMVKVTRNAPELIMIQLNGRTTMPVDEIIFNLREMIRRKTDQFGPVSYYPQIVLYKIDEEAEGLDLENLADTESILQRCSEANAQYIGSYSSITFLLKMKDFLTNSA